MNSFAERCVARFQVLFPSAVVADNEKCVISRFPVHHPGEVEEGLLLPFDTEVTESDKEVDSFK